MSDEVATTEAPKEYQWYNDPYLRDTKAPVQLLGAAMLVNPLADHTSSQRLMMFSNHLPQAQMIHGCEQPRVFTGYESVLGDYEFNTTERDQDIQIREVIPRFAVVNSTRVIKENPYHIIVYRGDSDNKVGYFTLDKYTMRSEGFGYKNVWFTEGVNQLHKGNYIPKELKLCTSPAHKGNMYMQGTNLRVAYMSLPEVTEDAFIISESAAKKFETETYGEISFKILPNQIPLDLYGDEDEYRFMPDMSEKVREDGILCALRTPTPTSIIYDMAPENFRTVQHLHDMVIYAPPGAEIVDIDVVVNRACSSKIKTPKEVFAQVEKYRDAINRSNLRIWEAYQDAVQEGLEVTPAFNNLVTRAVGSLLIDNVRIPGFNRRSNVSAVRRKEQIEFIYITVVYRHNHKCTNGLKLANRYGGKGVIAGIVPDDKMAIDEEGIRAEVCIDPISVFNRMNPAAWFEQFFNRGSELIQRRVKEMIETAPVGHKPWAQAYQLVIEYITDVHENWGKLVDENNKGDKRAFVEEVIRDGIYLQITPFQKGIDQHLVLKLAEKYNIRKSPVTYINQDMFGNDVKSTTKYPVMVGQEYFYLLYKMPHVRCPGIGYVNQYHTPIRANNTTKIQYPFSQTPLRLGEDEIRNLTTVSGPNTAAHILGAYANSSNAVECMANHLLFDKSPSQLQEIEVSVPDIIRSNSIIGVTKHIFSCIGIDITPQPEDIAPILQNQASIVGENTEEEDGGTTEDNED